LTEVRNRIITTATLIVKWFRLRVGKKIKMFNFKNWSLAAIVFVSGASVAQAATFSIEDKILAGDGAADDRFGSSVAIFGTTAIVGAQRDDDNGTNSGSAYLFDTTTGTQSAKLTASDGAASDNFGRSVDISGTTAIVGALFDDDNGTDSGSAYLFDTTSGAQIAKLTASDAAESAEFGISVAISGTTAIVGAYRDDEISVDSGAAYLFDTTTGNQIFKLTASDGAAFDEFGISVAISGTTAIVGAYRDDDNGFNSGSAYLFDTTTGAQIFKLTASDGAADDFFGWSVAIYGTTAIVGRLNQLNDSSGSAYLFDTTTGAQLAKLTASDAAAGDWFGHSVAIFDDIIMVTASHDEDNGTDSGSAYISSVFAATVVPLPAGVWLLLSGALALGWVRRRKSARA
jgi:hypothetical protein